MNMLRALARLLLEAACDGDKCKTNPMAAMLRRCITVEQAVCFRGVETDE